MTTVEETFSLRVLTPKGLALQEQVSFLKLPSTKGEVGIMPGHTSSVFQLDIGELLVSLLNNDDHYYFVVRGYAHVNTRETVILTPFLELRDDIDLTRAEASQKRALKRLKNQDSSLDKDRAELSLRRANQRIHLYHFYH
ncbi:MAG: ATP synthase F1 subunit epsilon [bacterium]